LLSSCLHCLPRLQASGGFRSEVRSAVGVDYSVGDGDGRRSKTGSDGTQVLQVWDGRGRITKKRARGSCTLQFEEEIGRRQLQ
jgi:hypothetical protein